MSRGYRYARQGLERVWRIVNDYEWHAPEDNHIDLSMHGIVHEINFDFEAPRLALETLDPPLFFEPMCLEFLINNPPLSSYLDEFHDYEDYLPMTGGRILSHTQCVANLIADEASDDRFSLHGISTRWDEYDTFFINCPFSRFYHFGEGNGRVMEYQRYDPQEDGTPNPHVVMISHEPKVAQEGRILYGELSILVSAMHSRATQPKVTSKKERKLIRKYPSGPERAQYPLLFPNEQYFPTLLISCVGLQHARILYGCMQGRTLVIRQSKLYSFEHKVTAPREFFGTWLLSRAIKTSG